MDDLNTDEGILESCAINQLPKILLALSNMARRSRQQMQRKGIFLGGLWLKEGLSEDDIPKQKQGILKVRDRKPTLSSLSTYNEIWKAYSFSYPFEGNNKSKERQSGRYWSIVSIPQQESETQSSLPHHLCRQRLQQEVYSSQATTIPGIIHVQLLLQPSIQGILLCRLKDTSMDLEERLSLMQLHYQRMLSNIPMHKLLRGRPTEFILPLPRRARGLSATKIKSLVGLQCVRDLPKSSHKAKWFNFLSYCNNHKYNCTEYGDDPTLISVVKSKNPKCGRGYLGVTVPKGVAFLTYPDSMDETSFEDTMGGRSLISWEKDTRFPQMGVDQSSEFKTRRELSRRTMILNRLRSAKFQRRRTYRIEPVSQPPFWYSFRKLIPRVFFKRKSIPLQSPSNSWFQLTQFGKSSRFITKRNMVASSFTVREGDEVLSCPDVDDTTLRLRNRTMAAQKAERRRRRNMRIRTILKYLTCGIVPFIYTGECKIFKRKRRISTVDSRESCQNGTSLVVPLESQIIPLSSITSSE